MRVTVIGAGAGGASAAVELTLAGHDVALWGRSAETVAPFTVQGVAYEGVLGDGVAVPALVTADLAEAIRDAEVAVVTLPTFAHPHVANALATGTLGPRPAGGAEPRHTGGALEFTAAFRAADPAVPPVVEFSTLAYVARKLEPGPGARDWPGESLRAAALPGARDAIPVAVHLFPGAADTGDVLASDLANVNMVLHPPGALLGAAWVEATGGDFTFYVQGMTPGVTRVMRALDQERLAVAAAYGHALPNLVEEMQRIGTAPADAPIDDYRQAIALGEANRYIKAPDSLRHRYYAEDFRPRIGAPPGLRRDCGRRHANRRRLANAWHDACRTKCVATARCPGDGHRRFRPRRSAAIGQGLIRCLHNSAPRGAIFDLTRRIKSHFVITKESNAGPRRTSLKKVAAMTPRSKRGFRLAGFATALLILWPVLSARAADDVHVRFSWKLKGEYAAFYTALDRGFFAKRGPERASRRGGRRACGTGGAAAGPGRYRGAAGHLRDLGDPEGHAHQADCDVPTQDAGGGHRASRHDMEGKSIATSVAETGTTYLSVLCKITSTDCGKIRRVQLDVQARVPAFMQNQVDLVTVYRNNDLPIIEQATKIHFPMLDMAAAGLAIPGLSLVSSDSLIQRRPDVLRRFLAAMAEGLAAMREDPAAAAASMVKNWPGAPPMPVVLAQVKATNDAIPLPASGKPVGWVEPASIDFSLQLLKSDEQIDNPKPAAAFFDNALLPQ